MKLQCSWNEKMNFMAEADQHQVKMDAKPPIGGNTALTPKQLLLAAICGCTGMDVIALLRKYKQSLETFQIDADAITTEGAFPAIFKNVQLTYKLIGPLEASRVVEAIQLSQTKYCGVSAMISKAVPISYRIELNGEQIGTGHADFKI